MVFVWLNILSHQPVPYMATMTKKTFSLELPEVTKRLYQFGKKMQEPRREFGKPKSAKFWKNLGHNLTLY